MPMLSMLSRLPVSDTILAFAGIAVGLLGLLVAGIALARSSRAMVRASGQITDEAAEVERLRGELDSILVALSETLRHIAVVRYDVPGGPGTDASWSMALLDDAGDGVVITALNERDRTYTSAKNIRGGEGDRPLASEESEAVSYAMGVSHR